MSTLEEKTQIAIQITNGKITLYPNQFKRIYPFTNENISGYIDLFSLKDTKLLTVGSSGDQAINASKKGCRDITVLDICPYAKDYFYLKDAAIQTFDLTDFERFLFFKGYKFGHFQNSQVFSDDAFKKLSSNLKELDSQSFAFWSTLFEQQKSTTVRSKLFSQDEFHPKVVRRINPYLQSESSYEETKAALEDTKLTFIESDIMSAELSDVYDNIFLSNLARCYSIEEMNILIHRLIPHLAPGGKILISYLYALMPNYDYHDGEPEIYNIYKALRVFPNPIKLATFESVNGSFFSDGALIYQKKK